jgi:hypothetical protein
MKTGHSEGGETSKFFRRKFLHQLRIGIFTSPAPSSSNLAHPCATDHPSRLSNFRQIQPNDSPIKRNHPRGRLDPAIELSEKGGFASKQVLD